MSVQLAGKQENKPLHSHFCSFVFVSNIQASMNITSHNKVVLVYGLQGNLNSRQEEGPFPLSALYPD